MDPITSILLSRSINTGWPSTEWDVFAISGNKIGNYTI